MRRKSPQEERFDDAGTGCAYCARPLIGHCRCRLFRVRHAQHVIATQATAGDWAFKCFIWSVTYLMLLKYTRKTCEGFQVTTC